MPQHINVQGVGIVAFPDEMSDEEITHAIETDILSPAGQARSRLSARGLTPEDVKAGRGLTTPDQIQEQAPTQKDGGFWSGVGRALNPIGWVAPPVAELVKTEGVMNNGDRLQPLDAQRPTVENLPDRMLSSVLPHPVDTARESYRRGEANESRADMYGGVAGAAAGYAVPKAVGAALPRLAPMLEESASAQYADALDPAGKNRPLAETIGDRLRNQGVKMTNPRTELKDAFGGHGGVVLEETPIQQFRNPVAMERQRLALRDKYPDAEIAQQGDKFVVRQMVDQTHPGSVDQQAADVLASGAKAPTPVLRGQVSKAVLGGAATGIATAVGGPVAGKVVGGLAGAADAVSIAKTVMSNPLWKTTSAVIKTDLAKAMKTGNTAAAMDIASKVIGGQALRDEYGHDEAVHGAVNDAIEKANGDPKQVRQILHGQEIFYENPDGSSVKVPYHIRLAFINTIGSLFDGNPAMAQSNGQGGQSQTGWAGGLSSREIKQSSTGETWPRSDTIKNDPEYPNAKNIRDENPAVSHPRDFLPPKFVNARKAVYGSPISGDIEKLPGVPDFPGETRGLFGLEMENDARSKQLAAGRGPDPPANTILIAGSQANNPKIYVHEGFHSAWHNDLTSADKDTFKQTFIATIKDFVADAQQAASRMPNASEMEIIQSVAPKYPRAIINYYLSFGNKPEQMYDEAFAESGAMYVTNPVAMKRDHPDLYETMRKIVGVEYTRPAEKRHVPTGNDRGKPHWEYPGGM